MAELGYSMKVAYRCIKRLDSMKTTAKDERPKTKRALQNVLFKETSLVIVNSVVNMLYDYKPNVRFSFAEDVYKPEHVLDKEIAELVKKRCEEQKRTVHILACDSNLHTGISSQIKDWYDHRKETFDPANPVQGIATACFLDYELNADQLYADLMDAGYIMADRNQVKLNLPSLKRMAALKRGLQKWQDKISSELGELTVRSYQKFAQTIIEVNAEIQGITAEKMGRYCEIEFAKRYPMFYPHVLDSDKVDGMIQQLSVDDDNMYISDNNKINKTCSSLNDTETMEISEELPTQTEELFPLDLSPEVAHAIVKLGSLTNKPVNVRTVLDALQSVCAITFIVSPKYVLSSLVDKKITKNFEKCAFFVQLHLGEIPKVKQTSLCNLTDISQYLSFPGMKDIFKKHKNTIERYRIISEENPQVKLPDKYDVPLEDIRDNVRAFQNFIHRRANEMAERRHAIVVYNDPEAEARCRKNLFTWLNQYTDEKGNECLTEEIFTNKLIELSFEERPLTSDDAIKTLKEIGYLNIEDEKVIYAPFYRVKQSYEDFGELQKFLGKWNTDPSIKDMPGRKQFSVPLPPNHSRKRKLMMPHRLEKKVKTLDL